MLVFAGIATCGDLAFMLTQLSDVDPCKRKETQCPPSCHQLTSEVCDCDKTFAFSWILFVRGVSPTSLCHITVINLGQYLAQKRQTNLLGWV